MSASPDKPRILAVDDSRVMRVAIKKILGKDYDVIEAEHGEDAWTLLINDDSIQVVFTDLSMPYLDGYGLLGRMRGSDDPRLQDMPVIIITGKEDDDAAKQQALERGASDFISKPFESIQLQARAKAHVNFKQTSSKLTNTEAKLERQAAVDEITGLGGQRYFCKAADDCIAYIKRHGGQYVLVRMDLDDFNQTFIKNGKQVADSLLRTIGQHLAKQVRQDDMLARVGLAKFGMFLRDTPIQKAEQFAERIRKTIAGMKFKLSNQELLQITVSMGLYEPDLNNDTGIKTQIETTESYLEQAIKQGGNCWISHSDSPVITAEHVNLETALAHIRHNETDKLANQANALLTRLFPVLDLISKQMGGDVSKLVDQLKQKAGD
ncbi:MAG: response regulator [Gammaproteobacteria bacterium]|jgi:two-component system, cell cycle response regulator